MDLRCSRPRLAAPSLLLALLLAVAFAATASAAPPNVHGFGKYHKKVCSTPGGRVAACHAEVDTDSTGTPLATGVPVAGYGPADLQSAYNIVSAAASQGAGRTVAIVDAYDNPKAEQDLATYRSTMGLPACTTANGCFKKVNENGGSTMPTGNTGWGEEIALDLDMVSAICPNCKILLVEASSASLDALGTGVNTAAAMGATAISNSYGTSGEFNGETAYGSAYYDHPGIDITVSSGDSGYGVEFPAAANTVTAVGGTHLVGSPSTGWSETAWSGAGSGCSAYFSKPSWQHDSGCSRRTVADVSAVADPNTGVAVYDTYGDAGWLVFGGTSVASPIVAALDTLAGGRTNTSDTPYGSFPYLHTSLFDDVLSGSNGNCGNYLCTAISGYDGPTGVGSPNGAAGLTAPTSAPVMQTAPAVSGTAASGSTLTVSNGSWDPAATSYAYAWYSCSAAPCPTAVSGATSSSYKLGAGDVGNVVYATVTATNSVGSSSPAQSNVVGPVAAGPPDFSLAASPASQSVVRGTSAAFSVTATPFNGFASNISLSVSGLPGGSKASWSRNPLVPGAWSSTLTIQTARNTGTGTKTLTITGQGGGLKRTTSVKLTVTK